jgi:uncharacterized protein
MTSEYGRRVKQAAVALYQRSDGMTLTELARAIGAPPSSVQRALESLSRSGMVTARGESGARHYVFPAESRAAESFLQFALLALPLDEALVTACRANRAVEFAGRDQHGLVAVVSPFAQPAEIVRFKRVTQMLSEDGKAFGVELVDRSDLRRRLRENRDLLERGRALQPIKGSSSRAFSDPHQHGPFDSRAVGRLHDSLPTPPRRRIEQLAQRNGLSRLSVFGSAVRQNFGPGSDVDVLIDWAPGKRSSIRSLLDVQRELEEIFGRDVDVLTIGGLPEPVRARAERDEVRLFG